MQICRFATLSKPTRIIPQRHPAVSPRKLRLVKPSVARRIRQRLLANDPHHIVNLALRSKHAGDLAAHLRSIAFAGLSKQALQLFAAWVERARAGHIAPPGLDSWSTMFRVGFADILCSPQAIKGILDTCLKLNAKQAWPDQRALAGVIERFGRMALFREADTLFRNSRKSYGTNLKPIVWKAYMNVQGMQGKLSSVRDVFKTWRAQKKQSQRLDAAPYLALIRQTALLSPDDGPALSDALRFAAKDKMPYHQMASETLMQWHLRKGRHQAVARVYSHAILQPTYQPTPQIYSTVLLALQRQKYANTVSEPVGVATVTVEPSWNSLMKLNSSREIGRGVHPRSVIRHLLQAQSQVGMPREPDSILPRPRTVLTPSVLNKGINLLLPDILTSTVLIRATDKLGIRIHQISAKYIIACMYDLWTRHVFEFPDWYREGLQPTLRRQSSSREMFEQLAWKVVLEHAGKGAAGVGGKNFAKGLQGLFKETWRQGRGNDETFEERVAYRWMDLAPERIN